MQIRYVIQVAIGGILILAPLANCQSANQADDPRRSERQGELVREIDDPHSGERWILTRNADHPEAPGQLVLIAETHSVTATPEKVAGRAPDGPAPIIRSGDRVIVEQNTPTVEARLEAVAMTSAWAGGTLRLRLIIGGQIVEATATVPGHAALLEGQP
jgi:hypothetical protein